MTKHSIIRVKERANLNNASAEKMGKRARKRGLSSEEFSARVS